MYLAICVFFNYFIVVQVQLSAFLEREGEGGRKTRREISIAFPLPQSQPRTWPACVLTPSQATFLFAGGTQSTEPHSPGHSFKVVPFHFQFSMGINILPTTLHISFLGTRLATRLKFNVEIIRSCSLKLYNFELSQANLDCMKKVSII